MPAPEFYDMTDPDSPGELGDTHLLIKEAARLAGVGRSGISHHLRTGYFTKALAWVTPDHCSNVERSAHYVVVEYNAELHTYIENGGIEGQHNAKRDEARKLAKRMSLRKVSDKTGVPVYTLRYWARRGVIQTQDPDIARQSATRGYQQRRKAEAYQRQCRAIKLNESGSSVGEIAKAIGVSKSTVYQYLNEKYEPVE